MKCYVCAERGIESDAVAICIVCGMGLCMKHALRKDREQWEGGYPFPAEKKGLKVPRILCPYCDAAMEGD